MRVAVALACTVSADRFRCRSQSMATAMVRPITSDVTTISSDKMINAPPFEATDQRPSRTGDARKEAKTTRTKLGWSLGGNGRDGAPWRWMSVVRQMHDRFLRLHDFHRSDVFRHHSLQ